MPRFVDDNLAFLATMEATIKEQKETFGTAFAPATEGELIRLLNDDTENSQLYLSDILAQLNPLKRALYKAIEGNTEKEELWKAYLDSEAKWVEILKTKFQHETITVEQCRDDWDDAYQRLFDKLDAEQMKLANNIKQCWAQDFQVELGYLFNFLPRHPDGSKILRLPQQNQEAACKALFFLVFEEFGIDSAPNKPEADDNRQLCFRGSTDNLILIAPDDGEVDPVIDFQAVRERLNAIGKQMASKPWKRLISAEGVAYECELAKEDKNWGWATFRHILDHTNNMNDYLALPHFTYGVYVDGKLVDLLRHESQIIEECLQEFENTDDANKNSHARTDAFHKSIGGQPRFMRVSGPLIRSILIDGMGVKINTREASSPERTGG